MLVWALKGESEVEADRNTAGALARRGSAVDVRAHLHRVVARALLRGLTVS